MRGADLSLVAGMVVFASAVPLLMRLKPNRLQRVLDRGRRPARPDAGAEAHVVRHFHLARRLASPLVGSGCLTRGLTLYYFLRRAGVDVSLCFGMRNTEGEFVGHCWLVRTDSPILENRDPRLLYTRIFSIPQDAARP
jgi:hypothetical protein